MNDTRQDDNPQHAENPWLELHYASLELGKQLHQGFMKVAIEVGEAMKPLIPFAKQASLQTDEDE